MAQSQFPLFGALLIVGLLAGFFIGRSRREQGLVQVLPSGDEPLLRMLMTHSPAALAMFDNQMRYLLASDRWLVDYGVQDQDIIGRSHYSVFPEIPERWRDIHQRCLEGEVMRSDADQFLRADGSMDWVRWEIHPWRLRDGRVGGLVMFTEVITEVVTAVQEAELARDKYLRLVEGLPDLVLELDAKGSIQFANRGLDGQTAQELRHQSLFSHLTVEGAETLKQAMFQARNAERIVTYDTCLETQNGARWFTVRLALLHREPQTYGFLVIFTDITKTKENELTLRRTAEELECRVRERTSDLQAANDDIRTFAYIVSHDLRAPLVNIMGFIGELNYCHGQFQKLLGQFDQDDPARISLDLLLEDDFSEALQFIEKAAAQMDRMINAVLRLSRLGHRELDIEAVNVAALIDKKREAMAFQLDGVDVDIGDLPIVNADPTSLEHIFGNLIANSVRYAHTERPLQLRIWGENGATHVTYHVADNGIGIAEDDQQRIFELFRRSGDHGRTGEGVGLAFVKAMVTRLGGRIWCASTLGEGATFSFTVQLGLKNQSSSTT